MQQRSARTSPQHATPRRATAHTAATHAGRAAVAVAATVVALSLTGRPNGAPRTVRGHVVAVSAGTLDGALAPALPRRTRALPEHLASPIATAAPAPATLTPRERLALGASGTYIGEILRMRDSAIVRWPERVDRPLTVWVASAAGLPDWRPAYLARVADAFGEWTRTGVPVRFRFVQDSGAAEVHVAWIDRFREPYSGKTVWSRDANWWITDANITLALHHYDGSPLDEDQVRAIALHEVGHLLGLDHTSDSSNIMAKRVRVRELSAADQATARLVYALPAGHL